ncbi:MAG: DUF488 domain-containing protein [Ruminiclostridium sp.]|nr:DUF488 domain-containing protein [Ruminiclostridium sp.]
MSEIKIKRIYQPIDDSDGFRILVDRLWARGISKEAAELYEWQKEAAPTAGLRKWFDHDPGKFNDFSSAYTAELDRNAFARQFADECKELLKQNNVTLLYAAKDESCNHALILKKWLEKAIAGEVQSCL